MRTIEELQTRLTQGKFEFSKHAFKRVIERNIGEAEIAQAGKSAVLIADYPDDKYSPSCLLLGFTQSGRALHIQASRIDSELVKIITIYQPDEIEWADNYSRRR